jgi:ABC-2 type transport system permease protein
VKVFKTLLRRELGVCFGVLNGYVIVSAALFLVGVCFYDLVYRLNNQPTDMTLTEMFFFSWYFWLILLLSAPLITMRTFAHEKSTGTYEILMTAPVNDIQVLMSKFCGALFFHAIIWLPVFISMLLLRFYINNPLVVNITSIITTYFAVLMVGALYILLDVLAQPHPQPDCGGNGELYVGHGDFYVERECALRGSRSRSNLADIGKDISG